MKIIKLLIILFASLIFVSSVNAVTTYAEWQNHQQSITINNGDQIYFDYSIFSMNPPISYSVKLYDNNYNLIRTYADTSTNEYFVSQRQYITQNDYQKAGNYKVVVYARDSLNDVSTSILNLIVNPVIINHAPVLNPIGDKRINEGELIHFTVSAFDPDNNRIFLTMFSDNLPVNARFIDNGDGTGVFLWQTDFDDSGVYNARFTASDSMLSDFEDITITILDVTQNNAPEVAILRPKQNEIISGIYNITWIATDPDQADETLDIKIEYTYNGYEWVTLEDGIDNNDGIFIWDTRTLSDANDYILRITATDDTNLQGRDEVYFRVDNLFSPNVKITTPRLNEIISGIYNITWIATDPDQADETLDIKIEYRSRERLENNFFNKIINSIKTIIQNKSQEQEWISLEDGVDNNDGIFTWDTTRVRNGDYELRIIATDDDMNTGTAYLQRFLINNVIIVNQDPVITSVPITNAIVNQQYSYDVEAYDPDEDPLTYYLIKAPRGMIININTGLILWKPESDQLGENSVVVVVRDNRGGSATQRFIITVTQGEIPKVVSRIHEFTINNIILDYNGKLNIYAYIRNSGNQDERINVRATIMQNGMQQITAFNLDNNHNGYVTLTFENLNKGFYVVKVEAFNSKVYEVRYAYIKI